MATEEAQPIPTEEAQPIPEQVLLVEVENVKHESFKTTEEVKVSFIEYWRHFLETAPDPIAMMVIRVELCIHKPCQTDATCNIVVRE